MKRKEYEHRWDIIDVRCNICYLPIHDQATLIKCPRCVNEFHRDHLAAWLLTTGACPVCRDQLSESFREEMRPKTERDRRRLETVLSTLDNLGDFLDDWESKQGKNKRLQEMRKLNPNAEVPSIRKYIFAGIGLVLWIVFVLAVFG